MIDIETHIVAEELNQNERRIRNCPEGRYSTSTSFLQGLKPAFVVLCARKKKPKELAVITECCSGCAGSPACVEYCPVEDCMFWVPDEDNPPFGRIQIDPIPCIGCKKCLSKGPDDCFLDGCPWDAIVMVDTAEVEKEVGPMAY